MNEYIVRFRNKYGGSRQHTLITADTQAEAQKLAERRLKTQAWKHCDVVIRVYDVTAVFDVFDSLRPKYGTE